MWSSLIPFAWRSRWMKPPFFAKAGQHTDIAALKQAWLAQVDVDGRREDGALTSVDNRIDNRT